MDLSARSLEELRERVRSAPNRAALRWLLVALRADRRRGARGLAELCERRLDLLLNCGFGDCHGLVSLQWRKSVHTLVYPVMLGVIR